MHDGEVMSRETIDAGNFHQSDDNACDCVSLSVEEANNKQYPEESGNDASTGSSSSCPSPSETSTLPKTESEDSSTSVRTSQGLRCPVIQFAAMARRWRVWTVAFVLVLVGVALVATCLGNHPDSLASAPSIPVIFGGGRLQHHPGSLTPLREAADARIQKAQLDVLTDLLAPVVSRVWEGGSSLDLQDYVASRRNDASVVRKGSPQHHALAWLSHTIVCRPVHGRHNKGSESSTAGGGGGGDYECEALLTRNQLLHRYALATVYFSWNGKAWKHSDGWLSYSHPASEGSSRQQQRQPSDVCLWKGVTCRNEAIKGRFQAGAEETIVGLDLSENNLWGYLNVAKEIRLLADLEDLNLSKNFLEGPIPDELGRLVGLRSLDLSTNKLRGELPPSLPDSWTRLEVLKLEHNLLVGGLYAASGNSSSSCRGNNLPRMLSADCSGTKPEVACPCCTVCCGTASDPVAAAASRTTSLRGGTLTKLTGLTECAEQPRPGVDDLAATLRDEPNP